MKDIIIFVATDSYIDHLKSMAVNCTIEGKYKGDFGLITHGHQPLLHDLFIHHKRFAAKLESEYSGFETKFDVFSHFWASYDRVAYFDLDVIIQDDLAPLFDLLNDGDLFMDTEDSTTMQTFWRDPNPQDHKAIYDLVVEKYPHVNNRTFNSAFILFRPQHIPADAPKLLEKIQREIEPINAMENGGTDQQIINLLFWEKCKPIPKKMVCFWGLAEPQNAVSEGRGWDGSENVIAIHFSRWYAQWIEKNSDQGAYFNHKLRQSNYDVYCKNLRAFNDVIRNPL